MDWMLVVQIAVNPLHSH